MFLETAGDPGVGRPGASTERVLGSAERDARRMGASGRAIVARSSRLAAQVQGTDGECGAEAGERSTEQGLGKDHVGDPPDQGPGDQSRQDPANQRADDTDRESARSVRGGQVRRRGRGGSPGLLDRSRDDQHRDGHAGPDHQGAAASGQAHTRPPTAAPVPTTAAVARWNPP